MERRTRWGSLTLAPIILGEYRTLWASVGLAHACPNYTRQYTYTYIQGFSVKYRITAHMQVAWHVAEQSLLLYNSATEDG